MIDNSAFQEDAFQTDAFQIVEGVATVAARGAPVGRTNNSAEPLHSPTTSGAPLGKWR